MCVILFFFFKQKTAYEMRISDWSSDVCSSDLIPRTSQQQHNFPDMLPRLHARMGGSGLRQREAAVHYRSQFPFSYERPDGFFQLIRDHRLETYRARAEGGPGQGQPPAQIGRASCRESVCKAV